MHASGARVGGGSGSGTYLPCPPKNASTAARQLPGASSQTIPRNIAGPDGIPSSNSNTRYVARGTHHVRVNPPRILSWELVN